jgi:hypothetical protein
MEYSTVLFPSLVSIRPSYRSIIYYIVRGVWRVACGVVVAWRGSGSTVRDGCEDKEGRVCDGMCWNGWMLVLALEDG